MWPMQKITPFLWFDDQAEEAATFYCSVFKNSKIREKTYYTGEEPMGKKGTDHDGGVRAERARVRGV